MIFISSGGIGPVDDSMKNLLYLLEDESICRDLVYRFLSGSVESKIHAPLNIGSRSQHFLFLFTGTICFESFTFYKQHASSLTRPRRCDHISTLISLCYFLFLFQSLYFTIYQTGLLCLYCPKKNPCEIQIVSRTSGIILFPRPSVHRKSIKSKTQSDRTFSMVSSHRTATPLLIIRQERNLTLPSIFHGTNSPAHHPLPKSSAR